MFRTIFHLLHKITAITIAIIIVLAAIFALTVLSDMTIGELLSSIRSAVTLGKQGENPLSSWQARDERDQDRRLSGRDSGQAGVTNGAGVTEDQAGVTKSPQDDKPTPRLTIGLVADSSGEHDKLTTALTQLRQANVDLVIGLGDYTTVGEKEELEKAKAAFDASGLPSYVLPGDHDLWDGRDDHLGSHAYVSSVFGFRPNSQMYQVVEAGETRLILIDNADNEKGLSPEQWSWLNGILSEGKRSSWQARDERDQDLSTRDSGQAGMTKSMSSWLVQDRSLNGLDSGQAGMTKSMSSWLVQDRSLNGLDSGQAEGGPGSQSERQRLRSSRSDKAIFIFLHKPIYHPTTIHIMGQYNDDVAAQAQELRRLLGDASVRAVISGDLHFFAEFTDEDYQLPMVTIGALAEERNIQAPRFAILTIFEDNSWKVEDIEIDSAM